MKKHILLPFVLGLGLLLFTTPAKSQNFQIVASFGTAHNWAVPNAVLYEIDYYYPYHQIVHINRERRGRALFYNVLLEQRGQFVELIFGRQALILSVNYLRNYPLAQHICSGHCGFHANFYRTHQVVCNHRNHVQGFHRGHNHIAYRSGRNYNTYAARSSAANRQLRNTHVSHHRGSHHVNRQSNSRQVNNRGQIQNESVRNRNESSVSRSNSHRGEVSKNRSTVASDSRNREVSLAERSPSSNSRTSRNGVSASSRSRNK
jgi:hypothetical protein